uniref:S1 motif domain-containing protein n=1 Tax=Strombidium inclinatum TaxID=197538 RepID=A0A7S3IJ79_9SPIT|mmetsp:Transcript_22390/g.34649  ORF Transcript_22390/g.34649 Transcript_22390/m.34649 type:complete len:267 (+) Transcript_22390:2-802(+)
METVRAGEVLDFGDQGKSIRLHPGKNSIRCEVSGDNNEVKKYVATKTGMLHAQSYQVNLTRNGKSESKQKRDKVQVDILPFNSKRYYPQEDDTVIGVIKSKNPEFYQVDINAESYALLNTLEFQNATRKDKPNFQEGTLVYCRVKAADEHGKPQLSCINPLEKKAWNSGEAFFTDLKGGFVKDLSVAYCRQNLLSQKGDPLLEQLGSFLTFEMCVGFNGKVWVKGQSVVDTVFVLQALEEVSALQGDERTKRIEEVVGRLRASKKK